MKKGYWEKVKRWYRYWILHRTFGESVRLEDIPRIEIEKPDKIKIRSRCMRMRIAKGRCVKNKGRR